MFFLPKVQQSKSSKSINVRHYLEMTGKCNGKRVLRRTGIAFELTFAMPIKPNKFDNIIHTRRKFNRWQVSKLNSYTQMKFQASSIARASKQWKRSKHWIHGYFFFFQVLWLLEHLNRFMHKLGLAGATGRHTTVERCVWASSKFRAKLTPTQC